MSVRVKNIPFNMIFRHTIFLFLIKAHRYTLHLCNLSNLFRNFQSFFIRLKTFKIFFNLISDILARHYFVQVGQLIV